MTDERGPDDVTRLSYWFPKVRDAGLPVPATAWVDVSSEEQDDLVAMVGDGKEARLLDRLCDRIWAAAETLGIAPYFLRTDYTSAKHDWKRTCYLPSRAVLPSHVACLVECSLMANIMGLPIDRFVVRELLPTVPAFHAFNGRMPITREFRIFVRDGVIEHLQPYWSPDVFSNDRTAWVSNWRLLLETLSKLDEFERGMLELWTRKASAAVPGFWSVDWLWVPVRGWVLTDMAEGSQSYRWDPA